MTVVVGFDTATDDVAVALTREGEVVEERRLEARSGERPRHATVLLTELEAVASAAGGWNAVDLIGVGIGPGSFTGLRIGLATARALGQALGTPLVPVGTLEALARGLADGAGDEEPRSRLAVIDARRGQAFAALYGPDGEELWPALVASPDELARRVASLPRPPLAAGSGTLRFRRELEAAGAEVLADAAPAHRISAGHVCLLAEAGSPARPESIEPIYLRAPDAEIWLERDTP